MLKHRRTTFSSVRWSVNKQIQEGFEVFVSDADKPFGAVRRVTPHGRAELVVYVENTGDLTVALSAVSRLRIRRR